MRLFTYRSSISLVVLGSWERRSINQLKSFQVNKKERERVREKKFGKNKKIRERIQSDAGKGEDYSIESCEEKKT